MVDQKTLYQQRKKKIVGNKLATVGNNARHEKKKKSWQQVGNCWQQLATVGNKLATSWQQVGNKLATVGNSWQQLATVGNKLATERLEKHCTPASRPGAVALCVGRPKPRCGMEYA
jgi:hypothetical protein